jgi:DNA-directed RNA polymerase subunit E'/Rpb7
MYQRRDLTQTVQVAVAKVARGIDAVLLDQLRETIEGRCITEGYVQPASIALRSYSMGAAGVNVVSYSVTFSANLLLPLEGMELDCTVAHVTKLGVEASEGPLLVVVPRDHYVDSAAYQSLEVGKEFKAKVLSSKWQFGDQRIVVFAELADEPVVSALPPAEPEAEAGAGTGTASDDLEGFVSLPVRRVAAAGAGRRQTETYSTATVIKLDGGDEVP